MQLIPHDDLIGRDLDPISRFVMMEKNDKHIAKIHDNFSRDHTVASYFKCDFSYLSSKIPHLYTSLFTPSLGAFGGQKYPTCATL